MEGIVKKTLTDGYPEINTAAAGNALTEGPAARSYELVKDYKLTSDHDEAGGEGYTSVNIRNLSNTVIGTWGKDIDNSHESLRYLFDPEDGHPYKTSYTDVTGLFQLDSDGYYYYNMRKNGDNHFILYDAPA